jgi:hypothetical protein
MAVDLLDAIIQEVVTHVPLLRRRFTHNTTGGHYYEKDRHYTWAETRRRGRKLKAPTLTYHLWFAPDYVYFCILDFPGQRFYYADPNFPDNLYRELTPAKAVRYVEPC